MRKLARDVDLDVAIAETQKKDRIPDCAGTISDRESSGESSRGRPDSVKRGWGKFGFLDVSGGTTQSARPAHNKNKNNNNKKYDGP